MSSAVLDQGDEITRRWTGCLGSIHARQRLAIEEAHEAKIFESFLDRQSLAGMDTADAPVIACACHRPGQAPRCSSLKVSVAVHNAQCHPMLLLWSSLGPLRIVDLMGSQLTREVDSVLYTRTGLEVGVAASKTFTAQVALLSLIALKLAGLKKTIPEEEIEFILDQLYSLPEKMQAFLDGSHPIEEIAQRYYDRPFFLYLGRHIGLPVALEGALKLKEISYIPTEAYSAGEMKHGPIALLDEDTPVVCIATNSHVYDKVVSNIQETRARGAHVIAIATDGNEDIQHHADDVIYIPKSPAFLQAVLAVVPLQLLAYRIARLRGLNVDQPRNLAKTVTVE